MPQQHDLGNPLMPDIGYLVERARRYREVLMDLGEWDSDEGEA
jgi:hypothetical protein